MVGPLGKSPGVEVSYPVARHKSEKPPDDSCSHLFASFSGIQVFPPETLHTMKQRQVIHLGSSLNS